MSNQSPPTLAAGPVEPTPESLSKIISDAEINRVHGHANFGDMSPRKVVNDGVRKYAIGYHSGHTQLSILREHGLITKPRGYDANLTKKGKAYARALHHIDKAAPDELRIAKEALQHYRCACVAGHCAMSADDTDTPVDEQLCGRRAANALSALECTAA